MDPLHQIIAAVRASDEAAVRELLRSHPELADARDETGDSILLMSVYDDKPAIRDIILGHHPSVSIFEAAALGDAAGVRDRVGRFPELVHAFSHDGFTALHLAAFFGREDVAGILLDAGSDVNAVSTNQTFARLATPLHSAVAGRHPGVARLLIERGANVNLRQDGGFTPLHAAALSGDAASAAELLRHGADRHLRSDDHRTPADIAREKRFAELERLLA
jgi:ankyrin repeat protein